VDTLKPIVNRIQQSGLITLDLETFIPKDEEMAAIDLKDFLFKGLILREADFRETVKKTDWSQYKDKYVALYCSADAVIPMWAYMILSAELSPYAKDLAAVNPTNAAQIFFDNRLAALDMEAFRGQRVVVKGCGDKRTSEAAYVRITQQLSKVARVVMFGEPCSTVPVFKKAAE
jgi:hypothetical protein